MNPAVAPQIFGVRHLSPGAAWHLRNFLEKIRPSLILIEGLSDATEIIPHITNRRTRPPIAILAYTEEVPVHTVVYPLAQYSPEYQALWWARENGVEARFIDLPSAIFLALEKRRQERLLAALAQEASEPAESDKPTEGEQGEAEPAKTPVTEATAAKTAGETSEESDESPTLCRPSIYERLALALGEPDYETYWEKHFEHNLHEDAYRLAALELGRGLRELAEGTPYDEAENGVREAFMRREIRQAVAEGHDPARIAVFVGAYHAPVLSADGPPMSDEELTRLPQVPAKLTLMPYSYFKLSAQSGYGAGNRAPAYFELMWEHLQGDTLAQLPADYLSRLVRFLREAGTHRSTAEVIEGVRLANTMAALSEGSQPTLRDLKDAAITLFGQGEPAVVAEAMAKVEVGTAIGHLPAGLCQTSIQDDFNRELKRLKLEEYKTTVEKPLELDLREERRAKTEETAWRNLYRSRFFFRLNVLEIGFAKQQTSRQKDADWAENWVLQWSPESEIQLVEAVLLGETIEIATAYKLKTRLQECTSIDEAALTIRCSQECGLMETAQQALQTLQGLASQSGEFAPIARAVAQLRTTVRYGEVRRFETKPLLPLLQQLFLKGTLLLIPAANCNNEAAREILEGMNHLNIVASENHELVTEELWISRLHELSNRDDRNPLLSGYACAILLERGRLANEDLAREVSRRLSPGIEADLGAGWFEGLSKRNRAALISRVPLWEQLAAYVASLDEAQFRRALVFLRRTFGDFHPMQKRSIAENLGHVWGVSHDAVSETLNQPLTQEEQKKVDQLGDFDFDDLV